MIRKQTMIYHTLNTSNFPEMPRQWLLGFAVWFALIVPLGAFWVANTNTAKAQTVQTQVAKSQAQVLDVLNANSPQARVNAETRLAPTLTNAAGINGAPTFALAPQDPKYIVMTDRRDVLTSHDGGVTWLRQSNVLPSTAATIAVSPADENVLYTGITDFGFYKSADGGKIWQPMNTGLSVMPGGRFGITAIAVDPKNADRIFIAAGVWVGTSHVTFYPMGIMGSSNGGKTWSNVENDAAALQTGRLLFVENALYAVSGNQVRQLETD